MRADARRNRLEIIRAARELVERVGVVVPLDDIARAAGIGPGTLHRHFPTKAALLAAVVIDRMEHNVAAVAALTDTPAAEHPLEQALLLLLDEGDRSIAMKAALASTGFDLRTAAPETSGALRNALQTLLDREQVAGTIRDDIDIDDVLAILAGVFAALRHAPRADGTQLARIMFAGLYRLSP